MSKLRLGALVLVVVCTGALAALVQKPAAEKVAGESLDLLKSMAARSSTAHTYISSCVTAIAQTQRFEGRDDASSAAIARSWADAAARCRGMAQAVCELPDLQAPGEACNRIRRYALLR